MQEQTKKRENLFLFSTVKLLTQMFIVFQKTDVYLIKDLIIRRSEKQICKMLSEENNLNLQIFFEGLGNWNFIFIFSFW